MTDPQEPATPPRETFPAAAAPSRPPAANAKQRQPGWPLRVATCVVYVALLAWGVHSRRPAGLQDIAILAVGYAAGLAVVLIVALSFFSMWERFRTPRNRLRILLGVGVFLMVAVAPEVARRNHEKLQRDIANAEIRKTVDTLRQLVNGGYGMPEDVPSVDPAPKASGLYGETERALKTVASQRLAQHRAYLQELQEIGLPRLLDANRLARDTGLIESRLILEQAERIVPAYRQQSLQVLSGMPALVRSLSITEPQKEEILTVLKTSNAASSAKLARVWDLEAEILHELSLMITLLDDNRQYWYADHDELLFGRDGDLRRFHQHQDTISKMVSEQEQLGTQPLTTLLQSPLR